MEKISERKGGRGMERKGKKTPLFQIESLIVPGMARHYKKGGAKKTQRERKETGGHVATEGKIHHLETISKGERESSRVGGKQGERTFLHEHV